MANPYHDRFGMFTTREQAYTISGRRKRRKSTVQERARKRRATFLPRKRERKQIYGDEQSFLEPRTVRDLFVKFAVDIEAYDGKPERINELFSFGFVFPEKVSSESIERKIRNGNIENYIKKQLPSTLHFKKLVFYETNLDIYGRKIKIEKIK